MKSLFLCTSGLQVFSVVSIVEDLKSRDPNFKADAIFVEYRRSIHKISKIVEGRGVFDRIYYLPTDKVPSMKHAWKDITHIIPRFLGGFKRTRALACDLYFSPSLPINFDGYSDFYTAVWFEISQWIRKRLSKDCVIHRYEDGIGSYLSSELEPCENDVLLFEPLLSDYPSDKIIPIKKITRDNSVIRDIAKELCGDTHCRFPEILIVDQSWGANAVLSTHPSEEQRRVWNRRMALMDLIIKREGQDRCGILVHPKAKPKEIQALKDKFGEKTIIDLEGVPLEALILHSDYIPEKFYTIASSAAFYWKVACDLSGNSKMIFLINDFQFDDAVLKGSPKILDKLKSLYPDLVEISERLVLDKEN